MEGGRRASGRLDSRGRTRPRDRRRVLRLDQSRARVRRKVAVDVWPEMLASRGVRASKPLCSTSPSDLAYAWRSGRSMWCWRRTCSSTSSRIPRRVSCAMLRRCCDPAAASFSFSRISGMPGAATSTTTRTARSSRTFRCPRCCRSQGSRWKLCRPTVPPVLDARCRELWCSPGWCGHTCARRSSRWRARCW